METRKKVKRRPISVKIQRLLQKEVDSKCPFCGNEDVDHFQIHHIDENPSNDVIENLVMLCPTCHSKITKQDIAMNTVKGIKIKLATKKAGIFEKSEVEAEYPGGFLAWQKFLKEELRYPDQAIDAGITGTVVITFIVNRDGVISDIDASSGHILLVSEAIRVIKKSGRWLPALQNGRNVKSYKKQPIGFYLH